MSKNTSFSPTFPLNIVARLAIVLLCVSSSLVISDISWGTNSPQKKDVNSLIEKLDTNDEWERKETIEKLRENRKNIITKLVEAALDESLLVHIGVEEILEDLNKTKELPDELINALGSSGTTQNAEIRRRRAIKLLSQIEWELKPKASKIVSKLTNYLDPNDNTTLRYATNTLKKIGTDAANKDILEKLTKLLQENNNPYVLRNTADALGAICEKDAINKINNSDNKKHCENLENNVIEKLTNLLVKNDKNKYQDEDVLRSSANALNKINPESLKSRTIDALLKLLTHKNKKVVRNAIDALGILHDKTSTGQVIDKLNELLDKEDYSSHAANALKNLANQKNYDE